ncbi:class I SAM-dependent methyltransferase [Mycolicibacter longobardus]|uniref:Methyltransferase type 12 n=1 Tax=Mycolicibacter longobardus TaxID=1108812 RepID=A0A1X1Y7G3_9MYCO|nr:class I SAM-dependent methyltransferase [Mycolicibacter longobardus]ORW07063.1 methyltransferase type 12 [Mycolicibacter longobardus]
MENSHTSARPPGLHDAMARRLYRRAEASGQIKLPAVPDMLDEYVTMCETLFAGVGAPLDDDQRDQLRANLRKELAAAFEASSRSTIIVSYEFPIGSVLNYVIRAEWQTIEAGYESWLATRQPPLFGTEPDARVWALACEAADPRSCRVLDIGAGTGRNSLALARRGHPVDAVEMTPIFAADIRAGAHREALDVRVVQRDVFAGGDSLRSDYQLIVLSEVTPDFRTTQQLRDIFELAAQRLAPGGRFVLNVFVTRGGYVPDAAARELSQQCYNMFYTWDEMNYAADGLGLQLVGDDLVYEYEKAHLPDGAWPPTGWFADWARGLDVFDLEPDACPIELHWLIYQKPVEGDEATTAR